MIQKNIHWFILSSKISLILLLFFSSCSDHTLNDSEKIRSILVDSLGISNLQPNILILSEDGCPKCNNILNNILKDFSFDSLTVIISNVRHSADTIKKEKFKENYYVDYRQLVYLYDFTKANSAFIRLDKNEIDTIINITPSTFKEDLSYIKKYTNSNLPL